MASGTITGSTNNKYISARIQWSESSINNTANTSVVTATLSYCKSSSSTSATSGTLSYTLTINGSSVSGSAKVTLSANNTWKEIVSHSVTVTHDTNGSKSISISATGGISGTTFTSTSCSATVALSTIPRAASIDSFISDSTDLDSTTTFTVKYTPKTTSYYYKLRMSIPNVASIHKVSIGNISSTSQQTQADTFTYDEITSLLSSYVTSAQSVTLGAVIETYSDSGYSSKIGESSELTLTMTVPDSLTNGSSTVSLLPSIGTFTLTRVANGVPTSIAYYVQNMSKCTIAYGATAQQGASITTYVISATGLSNISATSSGSTTLGAFTNSGTVTIKVAVTDSRGKTNSKSSTITVYPHGNPTVSLKAQRCDSSGTLDNNGTYVLVTPTYSVNGDVNGSNTIESASLTSSPSVVSTTNMTSGTSFVGGGGNVSLTSAYVLTLVVTDTIGASTAITTEVGVATVIIDKAHNSNTGKDRLGLLSYGLYDGITVNTDESTYDMDGNVILWVTLTDTYDDTGGVDSIPTYVNTEALRVANLVQTKLDEITTAGGTPFTVLCMSDAHDAPSTSSVSNADNITSGNVHGGMAAKILTDTLDIDACAYLGDYAWGYDSDSTDDNIADITAINERIDEAFDGIPQFRTVGNHDSGDYEGDTYLTAEELYTLIGSYNDDGTTVMGSTTAGYCYRDFADASVRIICLNTADGGTNTVSNEQLVWFVETLQSTPSGYYVFILSHHPLDYGGNPLLANIVYACYNKSSITLSGTSYDFSNFAGTIAASYHGHVHCYKVGNVNYISDSVGTPFDVKKIATPNMCYSRNNEYGTDASYFGIVVGEDTTYAKTANSATDTAFVVNVFNPLDFTVYSYHYGAGYDRTVYLGAESIAVTGVSLSATTLTLTKGSSSTLTVTFEPSNATDQTGTWSSSDTSVATVSNGVVTGVGAGSTTLTFTSNDGGYTASCTVTVEVATATISTTHGVRLSTSSGSEKTSTDYTTTEYIPVGKSAYPNGFTITVENAGDVVGNGSPYRDSASVLYNGTTFIASTYICSGNVSPYSWQSCTMTRTDDRTGLTFARDVGFADGYQIKLCVYDPDSTATFTIEGA